MTALCYGVVVLLLLWLALWTVIARDAFLAVAGFVVYGLLLSLLWVRLAGIDVALTEAAIGGGLTGALLLGAVGRLRGTEAEATAERSRPATRAVAALLSLAVASASVPRSRPTARSNSAPVRPPPMAASVSATSMPGSRTHTSASSRP